MADKRRCLRSRPRNVIPPTTAVTAPTGNSTEPRTVLAMESASIKKPAPAMNEQGTTCLLYTSDAADE